jgi:hypothetical protein
MKQIAIHRWALTSALALAVLFGAQPGWAQQAQRNLVDVGQRQFDELHYEEAVQTLSAAVIRSGNTPQIEARIYELLAMAYQALGRTDEAEGAWRLMLIRAPDRQASQDLSPRTQAFFNGVRQRWESEGRPGITVASTNNGTAVTATPGTPPAEVRIEHRSPPQQQRGRPVPLSASLVDPGNRVARLVLAFRHNNVGIFQRVDATRDETGTYAITLPGSIVRPPLVEYYFEAVDGNGLPVQQRGDALAPLRVAVPEPGGVPWWAWVGGGVLVAGAAVAIIVVATSNQPATLNIDVVGR